MAGEGVTGGMGPHTEPLILGENGKPDIGEGRPHRATGMGERWEWGTQNLSWGEIGGPRYGVGRGMGPHTAPSMGKEWQNLV